MANAHERHMQRQRQHERRCLPLPRWWIRRQVPAKGVSFAVAHHSSSNHCEPVDRSAEHGSPQHGEPHHGSPKHGEPQHAEPVDRSAEHAEPDDGSPQHSEPDDGSPQHAESHSDSFHDGSPQHAESHSDSFHDGVIDLHHRLSNSGDAHSLTLGDDSFHHPFG